MARRSSIDLYQDKQKATERYITTILPEYNQWKIKSITLVKLPALVILPAKSIYLTENIPLNFDVYVNILIIITLMLIIGWTSGYYKKCGKYPVNMRIVPPRSGYFTDNIGGKIPVPIELFIVILLELYREHLVKFTDYIVNREYFHSAHHQ